MKGLLKNSIITVLAMIALASCGSKVETSSCDSETSSTEQTSVKPIVESSEVESTIESSSEESVPTLYKVTFNNYDGTLLYETEVEEGQSAEYVGETPTRTAEDGADYTYEFKGWDRNLEEIIEDTIATAVFEPKTKEGWGDIIWC